MKYIILITIAALAVFCLGISALSEESSLVDSYIAKSQAEKPSWKTNDVFGGATPNEARTIWISELQNNTTLQETATAINTTAKAAAATSTGVSLTKSLVDEYIANSFDTTGTWESDDSFGYSTPREARKAELNQTE